MAEPGVAAEKTRRRMGRWQRVSLIVLVLTLLTVGGVVANFYIQMSGGLGSIALNRRKAPDPSGKKLVKARESAVASIITALDAVERDTSWTRYEQSTSDVCQKGQNNWKVKEGYAYKCGYRVTRFYGFDGDFRESMLDLDKDLKSSGWTIQYGTSIESAVEDYYNLRETLSAENKRPFLVSDMSGPGPYVSGDRELLIGFAEKSTVDGGIDGFRSLQEVRDGLEPIYEVHDVSDTQVIIDKVGAHDRYIVGIAVEQQYFLSD